MHLGHSSETKRVQRLRFRQLASHLIRQDNWIVFSHPGSQTQMFGKVRFQNFKSLRSVSLDLAPFTVLVGANGTGKSSVLQGLHYLSEVLQQPMAVDSYLDGPRAPYELHSRGADKPLTISLFGSTDPKANHACLRVADISKSGESWRFELSGTWRGQEISGNGGPGADAGTSAKVTGFPRSVMLQLDPAELAAPVLSDARTIEMSPSGKGLAGVLAEMLLSAPDEFERVQQRLRSVIPEVKRIRFRRAPMRSSNRARYGQQLVFDMKGASDLSAHGASEGTLTVLALLTLISDPIRPEVLLLDDLARSLHPKAQGDLIGVIREVMRENPSLQIVATHHSPYMLDYFAAEEVRLTSLGEDGSALWHPLTEHPEWQRWKQQMSVGEFWSTFGERWIRPANQAAE